MADDWVLCLGVPHDAARQALRDGSGPGLSLVYYEDAGEDDRRALLESAPAILCWSATVTADMVKAAGRVRLIQKIGEGTDKIAVEAAAAAGIAVARTSGLNSVSCAELTLLLVLAALRRLPPAHASMAQGRWGKWEVREGTHELRGKQVGIVGLGKIGALVATRVRAFGASVVYHNRRVLPPGRESEIGARYVSSDELLRRSDVVSVHLPLNPSTRHLIGARELGLMKPSAILVNTARGEVVDEQALVHALAGRRILAAGLDVYQEEPLPADHPLRSLDNVVLTPHVGGVTDDSRTLIVERAFQNIRLCLAGQPLPTEDVVTPAMASGRLP